MHIFKNTHYDFLRWRWHAIAVSWVIIIAGIITIATKGIPKGVEFAGGTVVIEQFDAGRLRAAGARARSIATIRAAVRTPSCSRTAIRRRMVMIRVPQVGAEAGDVADARSAEGRRRAREGEPRPAQPQGAEIVGATVGRELTSKGIWATVLSLVGILVYLAFRFQFSFGVGAVVATIHDLLITLAFLAFFRYDMSLNVIAAILTMTGFSTNDTIVIFDRIRENLRVMRRDSMNDIINASVNQTLSRTIITSGTALLTALALFFFGGEVLHGFAFTMVVGIITGTYSSVFIAAAIVSFWRGDAPARAAAHAPAMIARPRRRSSRSGSEAAAKGASV